MNKILLVTLVSLSASLSFAAAETDGQTVAVTEVRIAENEPGIGQYISRLLLSKKYLRLDDGRDDGDYTLFDRSSHEIHSFNHEDRSHLIMKPIEARAIDFKLEFRVNQNEMQDAPSVGGVTPVQHEYYADSRLCKQSVNVQGLLPEMTTALIDYEQALVAQNSQTLDRIPAGVRSSCYMANNYLYASDYLKQGFPLFVMDDLGRQKQLLSFSNTDMPASLFQPMTGYKVYYPNAANLEQ